MAKCPVCKKATTFDTRPFCSQRCKDVDLGRWMLGSYALPSEEPLGETEIEQVIQNLQENSDDKGLY